MKSTELDSILNKQFGDFIVLGENQEKNSYNRERKKNKIIKSYNKEYLCKCTMCNQVKSFPVTKIKNNPLCSECNHTRYFGEDLSGKTFGNWEVLERDFSKKNISENYWKCRCSCGDIYSVKKTHLVSGRSKKCRKCNSQSRIKYKENDLRGKIINNVFFEKMSERDKTNRIKWDCSCVKCKKNFTIRTDKINSDKIYCPYCSRKEGALKGLETKRKEKIKEEGNFKEDLLKFLTEEEITKIWSNKNKNLPEYFTHKSHRTIFIKCQRCNKNFKTSPLDFQNKILNNLSLSDIICPKCFYKLYSSYIQRTVENFLEKDLKLKVLTEYDCNLKPLYLKNIRLRYDIEIVKYKIIIEVMGKQHDNLLSQESKWLHGKTPQEYLKDYKNRDEFKKKYAIDNGYRYLAITQEEVLNGTYKDMIKELIKSC